MYISLYRKYRPKVFSDSLGHSHIVDILKKQISTNRTGHAYLFTGVRGTGKTTFAKILAKAFNCLDLKNGEPCLECENCKGIEEGKILDIIEMDAASNTGVDNIRTIIEESEYMPSKAKYRVYIIDEVHMLSQGAFNALLKTLEEPPEHVKFILATTEPQKIPATILSRCQKFEFKKVNEDDIASRLKYISEKEKIKITKEAIDLISILAEGSFRDGISILESARAYDGEITEEVVRKIVGLPVFEKTIELTKQLILGEKEKVFALLEEFLYEGREPNIILNEILNVLEAILVKEKHRVNRFNKSQKNLLKELSFYDQDRMFYLIKQIALLSNELKWSERKNSILIAGLIAECNFKDYIKKEQKSDLMEASDIVEILKGERKVEILDNDKIKTELNDNELEKKSKEEKNELKKLDNIQLQNLIRKKENRKIFVLMLKSDVFYGDGKAYIVKHKDIVHSPEDIEVIESKETIQFLERTISEILNEKIEVNIERWK